MDIDFFSLPREGPQGAAAFSPAPSPPSLRGHQTWSLHLLLILASSGQALLGMSALLTTQDCCPFCPQNLGHHVTYLGVQQTLAECHFIASHAVCLPSPSVAAPGFSPSTSSSACLKPSPCRTEFQQLNGTSMAFQGQAPTPRRCHLLMSPHTQQHMTELSPLPSSVAVPCPVFSPVLERTTPFCCDKHHWTAHCPTPTGVPTFPLCTP